MNRTSILLALLACLSLAFAGCGKDDKKGKKDDGKAKKDDGKAKKDDGKAKKDDGKAKKDDGKAKKDAMVQVATLEAKNDSGVGGTITFTQVADKVEIAADLTGLTEGEHGFHIHAKGDCSAHDGKSAGGHFDPADTKTHGAPDAAADKKHAGDLGNVKAGADGAAKLAMTADWITLGEGDNSIAGLAVIVHAKPDTYGQPTGDAGGRVACGVINAKK